MEQPESILEESLMTRSFAILSTLVLASAALAHADNIITFQIVNGSLTTGEAVNGLVVIDTTLGSIVSENVMTTFDGTPYDFTTPDGQTLTDHDYYWNFTDGTADGDIFQLSVPLPGLIGYTGSTVCSATTPCYDAANNTNYEGAFISAAGDDFITTGSLVPTPEPSGLLLLGTGVMGMLGAAYRRRKGSSRA
jgi:PEP-CTERM motif